MSDPAQADPAGLEPRHHIGVDHLRVELRHPVAGSLPRDAESF